MRIDGVDWFPVDIRRREAFRIASAPSTDVAPNVFVRVTSGNLMGWGCATPNHVTEETAETIVATLPKLAATLRGAEAEGLEEAGARMRKAVPGHPAARAGVDIALHDLMARERGVPLHRLLGSAERKQMLTDMTIPLLGYEETIARAVEWVQGGFHALKLKVGEDVGEDVRRVRGVRDAVGPEVALRVDANEGYGLDEAARFVREAAPARLECLEQPLPRDDLAGMQMLVQESPVPIMADEAVFTAKDVMTLKWGGCCHLINLKLMKTGGLRGAMEANVVCESAAFPVMVGCMGEPQVSVAAALHFALAQTNVRFADLDSWLNLSDDPSRGLVLRDGHLLAPRGPGLGIEVEL